MKPAVTSIPLSVGSAIVPGVRVNDNVVVVDRIGLGGMGSVWSARHQPLGIEVAVKFITPELLAEASVVERFRREARAAARVRSPHVVQVFDHGTTADGIPYIVMERLQGETLNERLKRKQRLTIQEAEWIVEDVCRGLDAAHRKGIVHRDIKPANLFLAKQDGRMLVKLLDFGVSYDEAGDVRLTQTGTIIGSPKYMSPEQLMTPSEADKRADLWSLAAVTYRILTGRTPFAGENVATIAVALNRGEHLAASVVNPDLPPAIDRWFFKAFERDIEERFSSAEQMARAFHFLLRGDHDDDQETVSLHLDIDELRGDAKTLVRRPAGLANAWRETLRMDSINNLSDDDDNEEEDDFSTEVTVGYLDDADTEDIMPTHRVALRHRSTIPKPPPPPPPPSDDSYDRRARRAASARSQQAALHYLNSGGSPAVGADPRLPTDPARDPNALVEQARRRRQLATVIVLSMIVLTLVLAMFFALTA